MREADAYDQVPMAAELEVIRYGVIGTGMMGVEHIQNILALDGAVVTAVADPHPESLDWAQLAVGETSDLARFTSATDLLDAGLCDAVVIASPNHTHHDALLAALDRPVHVLIEKPLCTTLADCLEVVEAEAAGPPDRVVWMGLEYRYMPPTQRLMAELASGTAGVVKMVSIREHRFPFLPKVGGWNRFNRTTGGTLVEKCCHFFDLMNQVVDARPVRVMASGAQSVNHLDEVYDGEVPDILDNAFVVVEFDNGARGMLDLCMFAEATKNEQEICVVGDEGKLEALVTESVLRIGRRADGIGAVSESTIDNPDVKHVGLHHGASYLEHLDFAAAIREGRPSEVTLLDGLWSVALGVAAHRSIDTGGPVELASLPELDGIEFPRTKLRR
jgi:myo-inositol 2-dehydrogenase/D-chiro-inositol 1-dehydrogenase